MCWTMCMKKSWSASASTGEISAIAVNSSAPTKQHSRQTGASSCGSGESPVRTAHQRLP